MKCHHVGIACKDIESGLKTLRKLYEVISVSPVIFDERQEASVCLIETGNGVTLELVAGKRVENLARQGISYYHLCYEVDGIEREIERLQGAGARLISEPKPAALFNGRRVVFLWTAAGVIELLEEAREGRGERSL